MNHNYNCQCPECRLYRIKPKLISTMFVDDLNQSWFKPKHGEIVHRTDLNVIYIYDRVESEWVKQDE